MKKLSKILLASLLAIALLLTACAQPVEEAPAPETTPETDATTETTQTEALSGDLVYWSNWNPTENQGLVLAEAIEEFTTMYPDVNIEVVWNGRENRTLLLPALESGQQVDMFEQAVDMVMGQLGDYLLDLTPYYSEVYPTTNGMPYIDTIAQAPLNVIKDAKPDGIYAVPYQPSGFFMLYNKDHFEEAGIEAVPTTWGEFMDACEKLKAAGFIPLTSDDAYITQLAGAHMLQYQDIDWLTQAATNEDPTMFQDAAFESALSDFAQMYENGYFSPNLATNKYPAGQQEIAMGSVSMYYNGTWLPNEILASTGPDFNWGAFTYPEINSDITNSTYIQSNSQAFGINKNTESPEAAFAFAAFITGGKWDAELSTRTVGIPMSVDAEYPVQLADTEPYFAAMEVRIPSHFGLFSDAETTPVIKEAFLSVMTGSATPEEAMQNLPK